MMVRCIKGDAEIIQFTNSGIHMCDAATCLIVGTHYVQNLISRKQAPRLYVTANQTIMMIMPVDFVSGTLDFSSRSLEKGPVTQRESHQFCRPNSSHARRSPHDDGCCGQIH